MVECKRSGEMLKCWHSIMVLRGHGKALTCVRFTVSAPFKKEAIDDCFFLSRRNL